MENITLLPARANSTIYKANRKDCTGGCIVLEDRITDYAITINDTTAISVDTSLLNQPQVSTIEFNLTIYSTGENVVNWDGFEPQEQLALCRGENRFKIRRSQGDGYWSLQPISLSGQRLQKFYSTTDLTDVVGHNTCLISIDKAQSRDESNDWDMFQKTSLGAVNDWWSYRYYANEPIEVNAIFTAPVMLKIFYTNMRNDTTETQVGPTEIVVFGSNDRVNWTQILNTGKIKYKTGSKHQFNFDVEKFFKYFRFKFTFGNTSSGNFRFLPMALYGYETDTINVSGYLQYIMPVINSSWNGYNFLMNKDEMYESWNEYSIINPQSGTDVALHRNGSRANFKYFYVIPKPKRIRGIVWHNRYWTGFRLISIFASNDGLNWKEIFKKDICQVNSNWMPSRHQRNTICVDSKKEYSYYKIVTYTVSDNGDWLRLQHCMPFYLEEGEYKNFNSMIPQMNTNSQDGYLLIASHNGQGDAFKLFNRSERDYGGGNFTDGNWNVIIGLPQPEIVRGLYMQGPYEWYGRMPKHFKIQGSQNMATWTDIQEFRLSPNEWNDRYKERYYKIENSIPYMYYRLYVMLTQDNTTDWVRINQLGLTTENMDYGIHWFKDEYLVPILSSNSQDGYEITAQSYYSNNYAPWKAFNRDVSNDNGWAAADSTRTNANKECNTWIQIQVPEAIAPNLLYLHCRTGCQNQAPADFTLQASNDGETWDVLLTQTGQLNYTENYWALENETAYLYFRLNITKTNEANSHISIGAFDLLNRIYNTEPEDDDFIEYKDIVPNLTSNSDQGYVVSADSTLGRDYPEWKAFNDSGSWVSAQSGDVTTSRWLQIYNADGIEASRIVINWHYDCYALDYVIEGSNDGETYTTVVSVIDDNDHDPNPEFNFEKIKYKYWRIRSTRLHNLGNNTRMEINIWRFVIKEDTRQAIKSTDEHLIPVMNSASQDGYVVTESSYNVDSNNDVEQKGYRAFSRVVGVGTGGGYGGWLADTQSDSSTYECDEWLQVELPIAKVCNKIVMVCPMETNLHKVEGAPKDFTFEGSNDGETWDILLTQTNQTFKFIEPNIYEFDNENAYTYYRICITKTRSQYYPGIGNLYLLKREITQPIVEEEGGENNGENEGEGENNGESNNEGESNENEGE